MPKSNPFFRCKQIMALTKSRQFNYFSHFLTIFARFLIVDEG